MQEPPVLVPSTTPAPSREEQWGAPGHGGMPRNDHPSASSHKGLGPGSSRRGVRGGGAVQSNNGCNGSSPPPPLPAAPHRLIPQLCGLTAQVSRGGATGGWGQPPPRGKGFSSRRAVGDNRHCQRSNTFGHGDSQETAACPRGLPRKERARTQRSVSIWACSRSGPAGGGGETAAGEHSAGLWGGSAICAVTAGGRQGQAAGWGQHTGGCIAAPTHPEAALSAAAAAWHGATSGKTARGRASTTPRGGEERVTCPGGRPAPGRSAPPCKSSGICRPGPSPRAAVGSGPGSPKAAAGLRAGLPTRLLSPPRAPWPPQERSRRRGRRSRPLPRCRRRRLLPQRRRLRRSSPPRPPPGGCAARRPGAHTGGSRCLHRRGPAMGRPLTPPPPRGLRIHSGRGRAAETRPPLPSTVPPAQTQRRPPPLSPAGGRTELRSAPYTSGPATQPVASSSRNRGWRPAATASPLEFQLGAAALAAQPPGPHLLPGDKRMRRPASRAAPGKCGVSGVPHLPSAAGGGLQRGGALLLQGGVWP